jgi:predicted GNAT family acetyltransferase
MQPNLDFTVINNEETHRFEATIDGHLALIAYRRFPGKIVFDHTEVPAPLEGKGLAAKLTRTALDFARANQLRVVSLCPFVSSYIHRHAEVQDLVSPDELQRILSRAADAAKK